MAQGTIYGNEMLESPLQNAVFCVILIIGLLWKGVPIFEMKVILASKSPRRKEILQTLGIDFTILTADTAGIKHRPNRTVFFFTNIQPYLS